MPVQFLGWRPDITPAYLGAETAREQVSLQRERFEQSIGRDMWERGVREQELEQRGELAKLLEAGRVGRNVPDLWRQGFMERQLEQTRGIETEREAGRMARFTPPTPRPLSPAAEAWEMLKEGIEPPAGISEIELKKRAGVLPDWFSEMMYKMREEEIQDELRKSLKEGARIEGGKKRKSTRDVGTDLWQRVKDRFISDEPINLPERYERVAD